MLFSTFTQTLELLEQTTKRNALIEILANLFRQAEVGEVAYLSYLCQGRLVPFYEPLEIGMGDKMVAQAIAQSLNLERSDILDQYGQLGDLGLVVYRALAARPDITPSNLSVTDVHQSLYLIATTSGAGSIEKKVAQLSHLIAQMDPISAKHLVRIPLGTLRLGIGDPTILDAFSFAKAGDKSSRKVLERAYNETSDLGMIGQVLWQSGEEGVNKLRISVGRPIRSQLTERLPDGQKVIEKIGAVIVQTKFDGFRTQIHKNGDKVEIYSRNLENMTHMFPDIIKGVREQIKSETAILDAEAIAYNEDTGEFYRFQETTKRRRKHNVEATALKLPLKAFVFDLLYQDGTPLLELTYTERLQKLDALITPGDTLIIAKSELVDSATRLQLLLNEAITSGLEGLVVKRPDSPYQAGARNFNWVKLKRHSSGELHDTIDCVVLGYIYGRGKRTSFGAGALLVGVYDALLDEFKSVCKIGTGLTDLEWQEIRQRCDKITSPLKPARIDSAIIPSVWVEPQVVIEVLADEITRSPNHTAGKTTAELGYALRFPRLVGFRSQDKRAEDATSVVELLELYNQQTVADVANS